MDLTIRKGRPGDAEIVLGFFDEAVEWLVAKGRSGQWGTEPFTGNEKRTERVRGWVASGGLRIAEQAGEPVGALAMAENCPPHVEPVDEPEVYVDLLITSRSRAAAGLGARLLEEARQETARRGISLLRVDCWAGADGRLVRYYQGQGFTPTSSFDVGGWIGQVFEQRVS